MPNYTAMLAEIRSEIDSLMAQGTRIHDRLEALVKAMEAIQVLAKDSDLPILGPPPSLPDNDPGMTDKVRAILKNNPLRSLTAVEIRDVFLESDKYADAKVMLIHIHNTLKRLHKQGELDEIDAPENRKAYRAKFPGVDIMSLLAQPAQEAAKAGREATNAFAERMGRTTLSPPPGSSILNEEQQHEASKAERVPSWKAKR